MKKFLIPITLLAATVLLFNSCSGCVKKATKSVTEVGLSAVEGIAEAVNENGERIGKITTDAAGSIALGVGKSLNEQLETHASKVAAATGRILVQSVDGMLDGVTSEMKNHYDVVPHSENLCPEVKIEYMGKYKHGSVIDTYFIFNTQGTYSCKFECFDDKGLIFITKEMDVEKVDTDQNKYTLVSFAMDKPEAEKIGGLKDIKVTVVKK